MTINLVIFDCDGVLVDTEPRTNRVIASSLTKHGLPLRDAEVADMFVGGTMASVEKTARRMGARLPSDWLDMIYAEMLDAIGDDVPVFDDVFALLDTLRAAGVQIAIASNGPMRKMRVSLTPSGLFDRFAHAMYSGHDYTPKPDPHMIVHAMAKAGVSAAQTVYIDDSPTGARAGIAAGVRTIGFAPDGDDGRLAETGADIITSMREVAAAIGFPLAPPPQPAKSPVHFCPGCGSALQHTARYPWHFCNDCRGQAVDGQGRSLACFNTHASGGFGFRIAGTDEAYSCSGIIAFIKNRRVLITEARFGGTVAQPIRDDDSVRGGRGIADLTHKVTAPKNLKPWPAPKGGSLGRGRVKPSRR